MKIFKLILTTVTTLIFNYNSTLAGQSPQGTIFFEKSPFLLDFMTTFDQVRQRGAKYYLTIEIPEDAIEPLGKVSLTQTSGGENINFNLAETFAFLGSRDNRGRPVEVTAKLDNSTQERLMIVLTFPESIPAGNTLTIGLKPFRNPSLGGYYSFRVKTFPQGEKPLPLDLGVDLCTFFSLMVAVMIEV
jgi:hypothetical protein